MPGRAEGSPVAVAVHHVPVAAAVIDAFGLVLEANAAFGELLGRQPVGERVADLVEPVARPRVRALLADVEGAAAPPWCRFLGDEVLGPQVEVTGGPLDWTVGRACCSHPPTPMPTPTPSAPGSTRPSPCGPPTCWATAW